MRLGAFSVSLAVSDLAASMEFYGKLGFVSWESDVSEALDAGSRFIDSFDDDELLYGAGVRLKLPVRISYRDDPELAMALLLRAAEGHRRIIQDPAPVARLMHFGDHGIELELRFWIADPHEGVNNVRSDVNRAIWRRFREHGITIPVAQREVRLEMAAVRPEDPQPARDD
jgi:small-conductance mechanosensitive channel